jgi:hypothetical protein
MKNRHLIIAIPFLVMTPSVFMPLKAQTIVKDENKINQLQREVWWSEWDGHTPGWFYWLIELFEAERLNYDNNLGLINKSSLSDKTLSMRFSAIAGVL